MYMYMYIHVCVHVHVLLSVVTTEHGALILSSVSEAIRLLLRHIGIESCRLVPSSQMRSVIPHNLSLVFLEQCCDLLSSAVTENDWENCQAIIITLLVSV